MRDWAVLAVVGLTMAGCGTRGTAPGHGDADTLYMASAATCMERSIRKEKVQVPAGQSVSSVEVTIQYDAQSFERCMTAAGHPPARVDAEPYLVTARRCLSEARGAARPESVYAECVRRGGIEVEVEIPDAGR